MGSRASQLRNRQQVQDSTIVAPAAAESCCNANNSDIVNKQDGLNRSSKNINDDYENNNNSSKVDAVVDMTKIKATLNRIGTQILQENGLASNNTHQQLQAAQLEANGKSNGATNSNGSSQPSKASTLQRQTSHIQSLAQRIRRSSSLRAPKLRGLIPSFVTGKRKASTELSTPQQQAPLNEEVAPSPEGQAVSSPQEVVPETKEVSQDSPAVQNQADANASSTVEQPKSNETQVAPEEVKQQEQAEVGETSSSEQTAAPVQAEEPVQASVEPIPASDVTLAPQSENKVDQQADSQSHSQSNEAAPQDAIPVGTQTDIAAAAAPEAEQPKSDEAQAPTEETKDPVATNDGPHKEETPAREPEPVPEKSNEEAAQESAPTVEQPKSDETPAQTEEAKEPAQPVETNEESQKEEARMAEPEMSVEEAKEQKQPVATSEEPQQADVPAQEQGAPETQRDSADPESIKEKVKEEERQQQQEQAEVKETPSSEQSQAAPIQGEESVQANVDNTSASNETPASEPEKKVDGEAAEAVSEKPADQTNEQSNVESGQPVAEAQ